MKITDPMVGSNECCQIKWDPVVPEECHTSSFKIEPKICLLKGRQNQVFQVTFFSQDVDEYTFVVMASPKIKEDFKPDTLKLQQIPEEDDYSAPNII